jgi:hypothetical protein
MHRTFTAVLISVLTLISAPAWGVPVTDGFIHTGTTALDSNALYSMTGPDFSLDCQGVRVCGVLGVPGVGGFQGPGNPLDTRWFISASSFPGSSNLVLNGTTYHARGTLDFTVGQVLPAPTVTAPFTMVGNLDLLHPKTWAIRPSLEGAP